MHIEKGFISIATLAIGDLLISALPVNAGTKVTQIVDDTPKVTVIRDKPPHKRLVVKKASHLLFLIVIASS